jgi:hypothetical protein
MQRSNLKYQNTDVSFRAIYTVSYRLKARHRVQMEASLSSTTTKVENSNKEDPKESNAELKAIDEKVNNDDLLEMPSAMRRVDWRWAVAKGYLNKDTNEWNESMGGQKAYLKQRNDRMISRSMKLVSNQF